MKIADMKVGEVYAYNRGHHGRTQAMLMLDLGYYLVTRTETDVVVKLSVGKHTRPLRGARGMLAVPAPETVWSLVREGKEIKESLFDEIYSRYLIVTDNLPEHEDDLAHFSLDEFGDVIVLTPAQIPGRLKDQFASQEERRQQRDEKYAKQAAEERQRKEAFEASRQKASRHGVTTVEYMIGKHNRPAVRMSPEDFNRLMSLVPARRKR